MADSKVSELTTATSVGGSDLIYVVQSNTSKKATVSTLFANAANVVLKDVVSLDTTAQSLASPGAVSLSKTVTQLVIDASGGSITLAAGIVNQIKVITVVSSSGGTYTLSSNMAGNRVVSFTRVGDSAQLLFTNNKWHMIGGTASIT